MSKIPVKPSRPGLVVRDPHTKRPLPDKGGLVPDNTYWRRRLRSGDVLAAPELTTAAAAPVRPVQKVEE